MMEKAGGIFLSFLQRNGMVAVVILAVLAVRILLRKCPKKYSYGLWCIVGVRMIFDLPIASRFSLFNLVRLVKRKSQLTKIVHHTGLSGMHAQPVTKQVTQAAAGSHVTDQATHTAAGLTAALTTSQKICALLFFCMADWDAVIFGIWDLFLYKMPEDGTDGSSFNICKTDGGKYSLESKDMGM